MLMLANNSVAADKEFRFFFLHIPSYRRDGFIVLKALYPFHLFQ